MRPVFKTYPSGSRQPAGRREWRMPVVKAAQESRGLSQDTVLLFDGLKRFFSTKTHTQLYITYLVRSYVSEAPYRIAQRFSSTAMLAPAGPENGIQPEPSLASSIPP